MHYNDLKIPRSVDGVMWDRHSPKELLQYAIAALMYAPADHATIGRDVITKRHPLLKTLCLCLEDAVMDHRLAQAEEALIATLGQIREALRSGMLEQGGLPLLFVRVRSPGQLLSVYKRLGESGELLAGFVLPKFDSASCDGYLEAVRLVNAGAPHPVYMLPILESGPILHPAGRARELEAIRRALDSAADLVLSVRVGGNDLCNLLGVRRGVDQTIYQIAVLQDLIKDMVLAFGDRYVLSAPVWEYFGGEENPRWREGLLRELRLDRLNGFVGKTAIHPSQLEVIQRSLVVDAADYADAQAVAGWKGDSAVAKGIHTARMNEERVHRVWAEKVLALAKIYGVRELTV